MCVPRATSASSGGRIESRPLVHGCDNIDTSPRLALDVPGWCAATPGHAVKEGHSGFGAAIAMSIYDSLVEPRTGRAAWHVDMRPKFANSHAARLGVVRYFVNQAYSFQVLQAGSKSHVSLSSQVLTRS
mgnify:CR=1 FL=1